MSRGFIGSPWKKVHNKGSFILQVFCVHSIWCCYITMDFAMAASQNGVCITQQMCHEDNNIVSCQL
jgi:hypothetical protein